MLRSPTLLLFVVHYETMLKERHYALRDAEWVVVVLLGGAGISQPAASC